MSHSGAKNSFKEKKNKVLKLSSLDTLGAEVESSKYVEEFLDDKERFIPQVDYDKPKNFAKFGLAEKYYEDSIKRVYKTYPYDGSRYERTAWLNSSSYLDLHIFDNLYPRTTGHALFSPGAPADHAAVGNKGETVHDKTYKYGIPTTKEYILIKGGPHKDPDSTDTKGFFPDITSKTYADRGANIFNLSDNRESNLKIGGIDGNTIEFWLKKDAWTYNATANAQNEVLFDLYNISAVTASHANARFRIELDGKPNEDSPLRVTYMSGANGCFQVPLGHGSGSTSGSIYVTKASVADGNWHHYAIVIQNTGSNLLDPRKTSSAYSERKSNGTPIEVQEDFRSLRLELYIDGYHNTTVFTGSSVDYVSASLHATIGSLAAAPSSSEDVFDDTVMLGAGKLSASMDDFRFWKKARTGGEIGKFWRIPVGGGTNVDTANTNLGVYYKFNEGITGRSGTDATVLDYSGRISNGAWTGYSSDSRSTKSAMVESSASVAEFKDPILYSFHSDVDTLLTEKRLKGQVHDYENPTSLYKMLPEWISSQDAAGGGELKNLTQILASYFDTLALQIENLPRLKDISYPSSSYKPLPFSDKLLESVGFVTPEILANTTVVEEFLSLGEKKVGPYEDKIHNIRNLIYQNIYNNINFIYKSKGTEKAFRNLIRCFGIGDDVVNFNIYQNNSEFELGDNFKTVTERKKYVDFNASDRRNAVVYQMTGSGQVAATATNVLRADSFDYNDTFTVVVPTNAGGNGNTITVKWLDHNPAGGALPSAADKVIHIQGDPSGGDSDRRANLALVFNGTTDNTKVRFGSNTGGPDAVTDGIAGLTATEAAGTSYYVSLTATTLGTVGNEITVTDVVGTNTVQEDTLSNDKMTGGSGNAGQSHLKGVPANLAGAIGMTFECEAVFPRAANFKSTTSYSNPNLTSSIFGVHEPLTTEQSHQTTWADTDSANFQVFVYKESAGSKNVKFALTSAADTLNFTSDNGIASHVNTIKNYGLTSSLFYDVYDNQRWNFAVRIKPKTHYFNSIISGSDRRTPDNINLYQIDFYGASYAGEVLKDSFYLTASLSEAKGEEFVANPKRLYIGAHRTNITGTVLQSADMKVSSPRVWLTYLTNDEIKAHTRDPANFGVVSPYQNAYLFEGSGSRPVPKIETLALHWDFHDVTSSAADGTFSVKDISSGSVDLKARYGDLSQIINTQHAGVAYDFPANATGSIDVVYVPAVRQQPPEIVNSSDMVQILSRDDNRFTRDQRPITHFFAFEKSMSQVISKEMLNFFATIADFNNLIGEPVHRYRQTYKGMERLRQLLDRKSTV